MNFNLLDVEIISKSKIMKKVLSFLLVITICIPAFAQSIEVSPMAGWTVNGSVDSYYGSFDVENKQSFGGMLALEVSELTYVQFSFRKADARMRTFSYIGINDRNVYELGIEHYQIGGLREFKDGPLKPFGELSLGGSRYFFKENSSYDAWKFSANIGLGVKYFLGEVVGIRLQTNLIMPMEFNGVGIFVGGGTGGVSASGGASFRVPILHWEMSGGLVFRLAN